eukprot:TRINITY_DN6273_c0_g3_i1.p1 TRINITY_DN6273_c0_g3~~TRINITY_DN6273_c0_g3_i1.p1  ORF type:complete len:211 (+),score=44.16 TRINITY_DN6273_c0_g3_i1:70-633(+)
MATGKKKKNLTEPEDKDIFLLERPPINILKQMPQPPPTNVAKLLSDVLGEDIEIRAEEIRPEIKGAKKVPYLSSFFSKTESPKIREFCKYIKAKRKVQYCRALAEFITAHPNVYKFLQNKKQEKSMSRKLSRSAPKSEASPRSRKRKPESDLPDSEERKTKKSKSTEDSSIKKPKTKKTKKSLKNSS